MGEEPRTYAEFEKEVVVLNLFRNAPKPTGSENFPELMFRKKL